MALFTLELFQGLFWGSEPLSFAGEQTLKAFKSHSGSGSAEVQAVGSVFE